MKTALTFLFLIVPVMAQEPATSVKAAEAVRPQITANYTIRDGDTLTMSGEVEIRTTTFTVRADSAVLNTATGEIQASGNVRITPVPLTTKALALQVRNPIQPTYGFPTPIINSAK